MCAHSLKFGMRLRDQLLDSLSPRNLAALAPVWRGYGADLDADNQPVLDATPGKWKQRPSSQSTGIVAHCCFSRWDSQPQRHNCSEALPRRFSITAGAPDLCQRPSGRRERFWLGRLVYAIPTSHSAWALRYEGAGQIFADHRDWAPRLAAAWGVGGPFDETENRSSRGDSGMFYDRY